MYEHCSYCGKILNLLILEENKDYFIENENGTIFYLFRI